MGAQHSRDIPENEFIFENPLLVIININNTNH